MPWSERTGKRWLGSFITTFRFNEVIHYWALDGEWDCFENHYRPGRTARPPDRHLDERGAALTRRLEDSILQALPPPRCDERCDADFSYHPFDPR